MKTSQFSAAQIIKILDQAEKGDQTVGTVCREHGVSENTFSRWRTTYGGMSVNAAQRLKELEQENARRKRLLAERVLENDLLTELLGKKGCARLNDVTPCASSLMVACRYREPAR